jgi:hypothetical protein
MGEPSLVGHSEPKQVTPPILVILSNVKDLGAGVILSVRFFGVIILNK